jgi:hypothetical protein
MKKTAEEIADIVLAKTAAGFFKNLVSKIKPKVPTSLTIDLPKKVDRFAEMQHAFDAAKKQDQSFWGWLPLRK